MFKFRTQIGLRWFLVLLPVLGAVIGIMGRQWLQRTWLRREVTSAGARFDSFSGGNFSKFRGSRPYTNIILGGSSQIDAEWLKNHPQLAGEPNLTIALAGHTEFGDRELEQLFHFKNINALNLDGASVTDEGLAHLPGLPTLQRLRLSNTQITDDSVASLSNMRSLRYLNLFGTNLTADAIAELQRSLPHTYINASTQIDPPGVLKALMRNGLLTDDFQYDAPGAERFTQIPLLTDSPSGLTYTESEDGN